MGQYTLCSNSINFVINSAERNLPI